MGVLLVAKLLVYFGIIFCDTVFLGYSAGWFSYFENQRFADTIPEISYLAFFRSL